MNHAVEARFSHHFNVKEAQLHKNAVSWY